MTTILNVLIIIGGIYLIILGLAYLYQRKLIYFAQNLHKNYHYELLGPDDQEVQLTTADGVTINALWFRQQSPKGVLLFFHGNAGNLSNWQYLKDDLFSYGYDLFIIDYHGYGKSRGSPSEQTLYADAITSYKYLRKQNFVSEEIVVYGRSIGTGPAMELVTKKKVGKLILEAPFTSLPQLAQHHYPYLLPTLFLKDQYRNLQKAKQVRVPVLIFHGRYDQVVPFSFGQQMARAFPQQVQFIPIDEGSHNNLPTFPEYHRHLEAFLAR